MENSSKFDAITASDRINNNEILSTSGLKKGSLPVINGLNHDVITNNEEELTDCEQFRMIDNLPDSLDTSRETEDDGSKALLNDNIDNGNLVTGNYTSNQVSGLSKIPNGNVEDRIRGHGQDTANLQEGEEEGDDNSRSRRGCRVPWTFSLFSCHKNRDICLCTMFCPYVTQYRIGANSGNPKLARCLVVIVIIIIILSILRILPFLADNLPRVTSLLGVSPADSKFLDLLTRYKWHMYSVIVPLATIAVGIRLYILAKLRKQIRDEQNIRGNCCFDHLSILFCFWCSLCQMKGQLDYFKKCNSQGNPGESGNDDIDDENLVQVITTSQLADQNISGLLMDKSEQLVQNGTKHHTVVVMQENNATTQQDTKC